MSANSMRVPFPTPTDPAKTGRFDPRVDTQPVPVLKKSTEAAAVSRQNGAASSAESEVWQQMRNVEQAVARYLRHLGYPFGASVESTGKTALDPQGLTSSQPQPVASNQPDDTPPFDSEPIISGRMVRELTVSDRTDSVRSAPDQHPSVEVSEERPSCQTWQELADFFVSFGFTVNQYGERRLQTRVHHSQADQSEQWPGLAILQLVSWMLEKANLPFSMEAGAPSETEQPIGAAGHPASKTVQTFDRSNAMAGDGPQPAHPSGTMGRYQPQGQAGGSELISERLLAASSDDRESQKPTPKPGQGLARSINPAAASGSPFPLMSFLLILYAVARSIPPQS